MTLPIPENELEESMSFEEDESLHAYLGKQTDQKKAVGQPKSKMKNGDSVMSLVASPRRLAMRECKQVYDAKADTCVVFVVLNDRR